MDGREMGRRTRRRSRLGRTGRRRKRVGRVGSLGRRMRMWWRRRNRSWSRLHFLVALADGGLRP